MCHTGKAKGSSCAYGVETCALGVSSRRRHTRFKCDWSSDVCRLLLEIGRAHVLTPVTLESSMPSSASKKNTCAAGISFCLGVGSSLGANTDTHIGLTRLRDVLDG